MKTLTALTLFAGLFFMAGCGETATEEPAAQTPAAGAEVTDAAAVNEVCPIMEKAVTEDGGRSEWEGQTVGFCCPGCIKKWEALSAEEKKTKLAASMKADNKGAMLEGAGGQFVMAKSGSCCSESEATTKTSCCASTTAGTKTAACCSTEKTVATSAKASCCAAAKTTVTMTAAVNTNCPIMGSPVKAGGGSAEWNGKTVGFCCPGCIKKWDGLSEDEKTQKLTEASPADDKAGA